MRTWTLGLALLGALSLGTTECDHHDEEGNGTVAQDTYAFDGVRRVVNRTFLEVDLTVEDGLDRGRITCDENLLEHLWMEQEGDTLVIEKTPVIDLEPRVDCFARVIVEDLAQVEVRGSGVVLVDGRLDGLRDLVIAGSGELEVVDPVRSEHLRLEIAGAGDTTVHALGGARLEIEVAGSGDATFLAGTAADVDVTVEGAGDVDALAVTAPTGRVLVQGSGDVALTATEGVEIAIHGSGDVRIAGDPQDREVHVQGSGDVVFE
ncbi:MAG: GIN domain-containing protein [Sandaracinaceae bacterium]